MLNELLTIYITRWDFFLQLIAQHLCISFVAIALAVLLGLGLGILSSEYRRFSGPILGVVNIVYTVPSISMLGFLIPLSGIGDATAVIALTVYGLLPMVRTTHTGISGIDPRIIEAAEGMGSTRAQLLFRVKLPLAWLVIISGLRNTVIMTIALAGIASFIGAGGLGVAIYRGITTNNPAMTVAGSLLIALMAFFLDFLLGRCEKHVRKKKETLIHVRQTFQTGSGHPRYAHLGHAGFRALRQRPLRLFRFFEQRENRHQAHDRAVHSRRDAGPAD